MPLEIQRGNRRPVPAGMHCESQVIRIAQRVARETGGQVQVVRIGRTPAIRRVIITHSDIVATAPLIAGGRLVVNHLECGARVHSLTPARYMERK